MLVNKSLISVRGDEGIDASGLYAKCEAVVQGRSDLQCPLDVAGDQQADVCPGQNNCGFGMLSVCTSSARTCYDCAETCLHLFIMCTAAKVIC